MALFINGVGQDTFSMNGVSIDNLYVDDVLVWSSAVLESEYPNYQLTEALKNDGTFDYVDDSNNVADTYDGKLTESDGTTPLLNTTHIPEQSLLALPDGAIMDTQYIMPGARPGGNNLSDAIYGIYDADGSTKYKIYAFEYDSFDTVDIYQGDQDTPLERTHTGVDVNLLNESWKVTDARPEWIPAPLDEELVANPNFTTNIDGVTSSSDAIPSWSPNGVDGGSWRTTTNNGQRTSEYHVTGLEIGVEYIADAVIASSFGGGYYIFIRNTVANDTYGEMYNNGIYNGPVIFTATETAMKFRVGADSSTDGRYVDVDSITLKRNI